MSPVATAATCRRTAVLQQGGQATALDTARLAHQLFPSGALPRSASLPTPLRTYFHTSASFPAHPHTHLQKATGRGERERKFHYALFYSCTFQNLNILLTLRLIAFSLSACVCLSLSHTLFRAHRFNLPASGVFWHNTWQLVLPTISLLLLREFQFPWRLSSILKDHSLTIRAWFQLLRHLFLFVAIFPFRVGPCYLVLEIGAFEGGVACFASEGCGMARCGTSRQTDRRNGVL